MNRQSTNTQTKATQNRINTGATLHSSVSGLLQRKCACGNHTTAGGTCSSCKEGELLRKSDATSASSGISDVTPLVQNTLRLPGEPLDSSVRAAMEPRFGRSFGDVRVHRDSKAAQSAAAVGALAYTVGRDVVFGANQYQPQTLAGNKLIAHELTHVVQQKGERYHHGAPVVLDHDLGRAESEADAATESLHRGGGLHPISPLTPLTDNSRNVGSGDAYALHPFRAQRSTAGDVAGATIGGLGLGAIGALVGSLLGPVGAIVGGIVGGLIGGFAGLAVGDALTAEQRPLNDNERRELQFVFGNSLDLNVIRLAGAPIMSAGGFARTLPNIAYFPVDLYHSGIPMPLLVHEMTHAWQYQHGVSVFVTLFHALRGNYGYGGEAGLLAARRERRGFRSFNTEQQGDILKDYYVRSRGGDDVTAWIPFVEEVQGGFSPLRDPRLGESDLAHPGSGMAA